MPTILYILFKIHRIKLTKVEKQNKPYLWTYGLYEVS